MKRIVVVILILFTIHFWRYAILPDSFHKFTDLITYVVLGISFISLFQDKGLRFRNAIMLFLIGLVLNILSAHFNNSQSINDTFFSMGYYYFILLYFVLHALKTSRKELEGIIVAFAILYSIFHLLQSASFPRILFNENIFWDRGTVRMRIAGDGFLMLAYFLLLNRFLLKRNLLDLFLALFFFFILVMAGFRSLSAGAVLMSGVIFIRLVKYSPTNYFLIVIAVVLFIVLLQLESTSNVVDEMINASEQQQEMGDRYIRKMQYRYFTSEYPKNFSYYIVGGGFPGARSSYAHRLGYMTQEYGFYWVDLGLLGLWLVVGLGSTLGLIWYTVKGIFLKLKPDAIYLNVYLAYLLLVTNITLDQMYRFGIFGVVAIVLYLIDIARDEKEGKMVLEA